jgi:mevalonate kinase
MRYFVPSKTFLTGEYSVLVGGAALGLATSPCFEISYLKQESEFRFHPDSPAGRYLKKHGPNTHIQFHDPYLVHGVRGGFGKSTAEYLAAALPKIREKKQTVSEIHSEYLSFFANEKVQPSGVDLVFQCLGEVSYVSPSENIYRKLGWKFSDLDFFVISTGLKVKTHEHLEKLDLKFCADLPDYSNQVIDAYLHKNSSAFLNSMKTWTKTLRTRGLVDHGAAELRERLEKIPGVLLVKPCGALGADVMLVFFESEKHAVVQMQLRNQKIKIQASRENLTEGLFG